MTRFPTIIEAMEDDRLFGRFYQGESWNAWKAVLKASRGLRMTAAETTFFKSVAGDRDPPGHRAKELVLAIARRGGKDAIAALIAAYDAMAYKPDGRVRAGERPLILLLSADRSTQSRNLLRYVRALFEIPPLKALITRETQDGFELGNGVDVVVGTADWRTIRGRTVLTCIMNELAFWSGEDSANPDREIYRAIVPATLTLGDQASMIMISSVHRRSGLLYEKWSKHFGQNDSGTLVVTGGTRQFNPLVDQKIIDDAISDDPEAAGAEYLNCHWRDDLASYVTRLEIEAAIDRGIIVRARQNGVQYVSWIDASSGSGKDSMCACVGHREGDANCVIDCIIEIKPPFAPPDAVAQIATMLKSYGITRTMGDRWGLGFVESEFRRHGITLEYSDKNRSDLYREALPIIRSGRARLPDSPRMITQFCNLERRALPGGNERIDHPQRGGHHDDIAVVVAGCLVALSSPLSGAEGWIEHYRRMNEEPWRFGSVDHDAVRAPGGEFAYGFSSEPLVDIILPPPLVHGMAGVHFGEGKAYITVTSAEAHEWLSRPAVAEINQEIARKLGVETT